MTTYAQAVATLTDEGHDADEARTILDSLIDAGLEADQPEDDWVFADEEMDLARDQFGATYTAEGEIRLRGNVIGHFDADGGEWEVDVDVILAAHGAIRSGDWSRDHAPVREASPRLVEVAQRTLDRKRVAQQQQEATYAAFEHGERKVDIVRAAGITRPTLDAWLRGAGL